MCLFIILDIKEIILEQKQNNLILNLLVVLMILYIMRYIYDTRYQRDQLEAEAIQIIFKFVSEVTDIICHAIR